MIHQNNNAFYNFYLPKESTYFTNGYSSQKIALESWLASKADSADEIANLQRKVAELEENLAVLEDGLAADKAMDRALREVDACTIQELKTDNSRLRKTMQAGLSLAQMQLQNYQRILQDKP